MGIKYGLFIRILLFSILFSMHSSNSWGTVVLKLGHADPPFLPVSKGAERFARNVESMSGGKMKVEVFPSGTLGSLLSLIPQVENGVIDFAIVPTRAIVPRVNKAIILELPFLFSSYEEVDRFLEGKVGTSILGLLSKTRLQGLSYFELGFVGIASRKQAIRKVEDYKGLKIRIGTPEMIEKSVALLGASTIKLPLAEVYTALERGVADAALTTTLTYDYFKYNEILPFLSLTNHLYASYVLIMNQKRLASLSPELNAIISEAAMDASRYERELSRKNENSILEDMEKKGVTVVRDPDRESMRKSVDPVYEETRKRLDCEDCKIFPWCCL